MGAVVAGIGGVLNLLLAIAFSVAVLVRVARALRHRKLKRLGREVAGPIFDAGGVQSKIAGFTPTSASSVHEATTRSAPPSQATAAPDLERTKDDDASPPRH